MGSLPGMYLRHDKNEMMEKKKTADLNANSLHMIKQRACIRPERKWQNKEKRAKKKRAPKENEEKRLPKISVPTQPAIPPAAARPGAESQPFTRG